MRKSFFCETLETTMHFLPDCVKYCCTCAEGVGLKIEDFNQFDSKLVISEKNKYIKQFSKGIIPKQCDGCVLYKEKPFINVIQDFFKKRQNKISHIVVDHYKQCDCVCIYCLQKKLYPNITQNYELLPIIKQLYASNLIDEKNLTVEIQGGNISVLGEFNDLLQEFLSHNCHSFMLYTNMIKYMPQLEKLNNTSMVIVSLDCGSKTTFHKIKGIDAFDTVLYNLKRLRANSKVNYHLKYIIIKDINDNKEELNKFLEIAKEIDNYSTIVLDIDFNNTIISDEQTEFIIPKHYYELFQFAENYCNKNNITFFITPFIKHILAEGKYTR